MLLWRVIYYSASIELILIFPVQSPKHGLTLPLRKTFHESIRGMVAHWPHPVLCNSVCICFMFALREKDTFQNEHHQKSPWERPADAVRPHSLLEGASSPERPQTGEDSRSQLENSSALVQKKKKKKICSMMFCFTISSSEDHGTLLQRHDGRLRAVSVYG